MRNLKRDNHRTSTGLINPLLIARRCGKGDVIGAGIIKSSDTPNHEIHIPDDLTPNKVGNLVYRQFH